MNHEERHMIAGLFDRMRDVGNLDKDRDAETFIHQSMRENANSPYLLVQSVLAQEVALQEAGRRIEELEAELARAQSSSSAPRASAGFSGNSSSVPAGQPAPWEAQPAQAKAASSASSPWGAPVGGASSATSSSTPYTRSANGQGDARGNSSVPPAGAPQQAEPARRGGGFLGQAMTTAAGVAGGMLLANSIGSLFGGSGTASAATPSAATTALPQPTTPAADTSAEQASTQQASDDEWGEDADDWGGDNSGGDFEI